MRNVQVILEALYVLDIAPVEVERKAGLKEGLLLDLLVDRQNDLSNEELDRIAVVYGSQFKDVGYHFLSNTLFNGILVTKDRISI
jgi:hypothetical protein